MLYPKKLQRILHSLDRHIWVTGVVIQTVPALECAWLEEASRLLIPALRGILVLDHPADQHSRLLPSAQRRHAVRQGDQLDTPAGRLLGRRLPLEQARCGPADSHQPADLHNRPGRPAAAGGAGVAGALTAALTLTALCAPRLPNLGLHRGLAASVRPHQPQYPHQSHTRRVDLIGREGAVLINIDLVQELGQFAARN